MGEFSGQIVLTCSHTRRCPTWWLVLLWSFDKLQGLASYDVEPALDVVSQCIQPLSMLREVVIRWRDVTPLRRESPSSCNLSWSARPRPLSCLDAVCPIFCTLSPFSLASEGDPVSFTIQPPPDSHSVWPWTTFGTLKSARSQAAWASEALQTCAKALHAASSTRATLSAGPAAQAARWLLAGLFREAFLLMGFLFGGPLFHSEFIFAVGESRRPQASWKKKKVCIRASDYWKLSIC